MNLLDKIGFVAFAAASTVVTSGVLSYGAVYTNAYNIMINKNKGFMWLGVIGLAYSLYSFYTAVQKPKSLNMIIITDKDEVLEELDMLEELEELDMLEELEELDMLEELEELEELDMLEELDILYFLENWAKGTLYGTLLFASSCLLSAQMTPNLTANTLATGVIKSLLGSAFITCLYAADRVS